MEDYTGDYLESVYQYDEVESTRFIEPEMDSGVPYSYLEGDYMMFSTDKAKVDESSLKDINMEEKSMEDIWEGDRNQLDVERKFEPSYLVAFFFLWLLITFSAWNQERDLIAYLPRTEVPIEEESEEEEENLEKSSIDGFSFIERRREGFRESSIEGRLVESLHSRGMKDE